MKVTVLGQGRGKLFTHRGVTVTPRGHRAFEAVLPDGTRIRSRHNYSIRRAKRAICRIIDDFFRSERADQQFAPSHHREGRRLVQFPVRGATASAAA
jgi:hypothetical protein